MMFRIPFVLALISSSIACQVEDRPTSLNPRSFIHSAGLAGRYLFQADFETNGTMWLASSSGLHRYDGFRWTSHTTAQGLSSNFVRSVWVDRKSQQLWIGSDQGVLIVSLPGFEVQRRLRDELAGPNVRRIRPGADGSVWVCSDSWLMPPGTPAGLTRIDLRRWSTTRFTTENGLPTDYILDYHRSATGDDYALTNLGLARLEGDRFVPPGEAFERESLTTTVWSMASMPDGSLLAATASALHCERRGSWPIIARWNTDNPQLLCTQKGAFVLPLPARDRIVFLPAGDRRPPLELGATLNAAFANQFSQVNSPILQPYPRQLGAPRIEDVVEAPDGAIWITGRNLLVRWLPPGGMGGIKWREWAEHETLSFVVEGRAYTGKSGRFVPVDTSHSAADPDRTVAGLRQTEVPKALIGHQLRTDRQGTLWAFGHGGMFVRSRGEATWRTIHEGRHLNLFGLILLRGNAWYVIQDQRDGRWELEHFDGTRVTSYPIEARSAVGSRGDREEGYYAVDGGVCVVGTSGAPSIIRVPPGHAVQQAQRSDDGALWLTTQLGYLRFLPDGRPPETTCTTAVHSVLQGEELVVEIEVNEWYTPNDRAPFYGISYQLDSADWTPYAPLVGGELRLRDLSPGDHVLRIRARDEGLDVDPSPAELTFAVVQPGVSPQTLVTIGSIILLIATGTWSTYWVWRRKTRLDSLRQLLNKANKAILVVDTNRTVNESSRAANRLLGLSEQDLGRTRLDQILVDPIQLREIVAELSGSGTLQGFECNMRDSGGGLVTIALSAVPLPGRSGGWQLFLQDVTRERSVERQLQQARRLESVGQLAGGVSHEFNNLLSGILGHAELLHDAIEAGDTGPTMQGFAKLIIDASEHAGQLTQQLLEFSRQRMSFANPIDVNSIVGEVKHSLTRNPDPQLRIELDLHPEPAIVEADSSQLRSALLSLAVNGRDAIDGPGTLTIRTTIEQIEGEEPGLVGPVVPPGEFVCISVQDTGVGIPPEHLERIFEPFFTTKELGQGRGLGLAAVYGTVVGHGGTILVDSEPANGTTMRIYLPRVVGAVAPVSVAAEEPPAGAGRTVLVVEDEAFMRDLLQRFLERAGYRTILACDGMEAVKIYRQRSPQIDLVLMDVVMPRMDGIEATAEICRINPEALVLVASGFSAEADRERIFAAGARDILPKPFLRRELLLRIGRLSAMPTQRP